MSIGRGSTTRQDRSQRGQAKQRRVEPVATGALSDDRSDGAVAGQPVLSGSDPAATRTPVELSIAPERVLYCLLAIIAILLLAGILGIIAWLGFGRNTILGLRRLFDLDAENNIPTYFSAFQLLAGAVLLGVIARHHALIRSPWRWHFLVLAVGFSFMSVDEIASIHETQLDRLARALLGDTSIQWPWLVPGSVIAALVALSYLRFLLALPRRFALLFVASGAVFLAGALGAEWRGSEIVGHQLGIADWADPLEVYANWNYQLTMVVEEGLEMMGVALFIYALLLYIAHARITLVARVQG